MPKGWLRLAEQGNWNGKDVTPTSAYNMRTGMNITSMLSISRRRVLLAGGHLSQASVSRRDRRRGRWQRGLALIAYITQSGTPWPLCIHYSCRFSDTQFSIFEKGAFFHLHWFSIFHVRSSLFLRQYFCLQISTLPIRNCGLYAADIPSGHLRLGQSPPNHGHFLHHHLLLLLLHRQHPDAGNECSHQCRHRLAYTLQQQLLPLLAQRGSHSQQP